ncbi:MAG: LysM peptidoglycan-binding domain-containing protein [Chloroflexi bacterium]|nr:MAG: LysM peptidoglycan-binding domain-containing protein [Chloroflexota bacterium]
MRRALIILLAIVLLMLFSAMFVLAQEDTTTETKPAPAPQATEEVTITQETKPDDGQGGGSVENVTTQNTTTTAEDDYGTSSTVDDAVPQNTPPSSNEGQTSTVLSGDVTYIVQRGDVLDLIAAGFDVDTRCLAEQNGLLNNPNAIRAGQTLVISSSCPPYRGEATVGNPRNFDPQGVVGAVPDGQGGGAVDTSTPSTTLNAGDQTYVIQPGDVLDEIARSFNVSVISLQRRNNLFLAADVRPGLTIVIPGDAPPYGVFPPNDAIAGSVPVNTGQGGGGQGGGSTTPDDSVIYTVQAGDNILTIAARFGVTPSELAAANELFGEIELEEGRQLVIP